MVVRGVVASSFHSLVGRMRMGMVVMLSVVMVRIHGRGDAAVPAMLCVVAIRVVQFNVLVSKKGRKKQCGFGMLW